MRKIDVSPRLCIVLPCYNEEEVLPSTIDILKGKLEQLISGGKIAANSVALFVDDGSKDATWEIISTIANADALFEGLKLAHNRGHQNALLAGYSCTTKFCDICISMDADLQDDINAIDEMIDKYVAGANIVFGVRNDRSTDTTFKRASAGAFYKFMNALGVDTIPDHADFRLMDKKALQALSEYTEENMFLRGVVADIGLNTAVVFYKRKERTAGESKYPLRKMIAFAADGITSFSTKPLKIIGVLGGVVVLASIIAIIYSLISWASGNTISGWTTTVCSIWFIGGVLLLCISVLGEYIGKIYSEVKRRPRYIVQQDTTVKREANGFVGTSASNMQPVQMHPSMFPYEELCQNAAINCAGAYKDCEVAQVPGADFPGNVKWEVDRAHGASVLD